MPSTLVQLGLSRHRAGDLNGAADAYRDAMRRDPRDADATHLLGLVLFELGRRDEAFSLFEQSLALQPASAQFWSNYGEALRRGGHDDKAAAALEEAIRLDPALSQAYTNLGIVRAAGGDLAAAAALLRRSLELSPGSINARAHLARVLLDAGNIAEAMGEAERILQDDPNDAEALIVLGACHESAGMLASAESAFDRAAAADPNAAEGWSNLGNALRAQGKLDEAIAAGRRALVLAPDDATVHSNLLYSLVSSELAPEQIFADHEEYGRRHEKPISRPPAHADTPPAGRPLRIGLISGDFRNHPVAFFIDPLLQHLDRARFEIFCYSASHLADDTTRRLMSLTSQWRNIASLADDRAARMIRDDAIDILIDLAGHTADNRLPLLARRPAAVQATYLGYPGSTGMKSIDWRITDVLADPPGMTEHLHCERLMRLPCAWCYRSPADAPPPAAPAREIDADAVAFASFASAGKMSETTLSLWARVLVAAPDSKLLLKSKSWTEPAVRDRMIGRFRTKGMDPRRIEIAAPTIRFCDHLAAYSRCDIVLDTMPYAGTTTTCEALWMGVPVVTLAGASHVSRVGVSLLTNAGLPELVADSPDRFVEIAAALAKDRARRDDLRHHLRSRLSASRLLDGPAFVRSFEEALDLMWQHEISSPLYLRRQT